MFAVGLALAAISAQTAALEPRWPRSGLAPRHPSNSLTTVAVGGWHGITGKISGAIGIEPVVFPMDMFTTVPGSNIPTQIGAALCGLR